jgi:hypothetical protein
VNWADIFERAGAYETDVETIRERLAVRRSEGKSQEEDEENA